MPTPEEEKKSIQEEIQQLENRKKILLNRKIMEERRMRAHRLIERGAVLENVFPEFISMSGEHVQHYLRIFRRLYIQSRKQRGASE